MFLHDAVHILRRAPFMQQKRFLQLFRQGDLGFKALQLFLPGGIHPFVVQPAFTDRKQTGCAAEHLLQLLYIPFLHVLGIMRVDAGCTVYILPVTYKPGIPAVPFHITADGNAADAVLRCSCEHRFRVREPFTEQIDADIDVGRLMCRHCASPSINSIVPLNSKSVFHRFSDGIV